MKVLLISAHADDIEIGAGGTVAKFLREGHQIRWIIVAQPEPERIEEVQQVMKLLGVGDYEMLGFSDKSLEMNRQDILDQFDVTRDSFRPDLVIGPPYDWHQDHWTVHNEMMRAFKASSSIISYEPWIEKSFIPQLYIKLTPQDIETKREMMSKYVSQSKKIYTDFEYLRSRATLRGAQCNSEYAEAFEIERWML